MKRFLPIIILAIFAVGSLSAFLAVKGVRDKKAKEEADRAADYKLVSFDSNAAEKITVVSEGVEYVFELNGEGVWELTNSDDFTASQIYTTSICTTLSNLTAEKDYGKAGGEKLRMYGLDDPVKVTVSDGSKNYTVLVGDFSPNDDYCYVMTEGKDKIYAVSASSGEILGADRSAMKDTALIPYSDSEIKQITLIRDGETVYDLTLDEDTRLWSLPAEYSGLQIDNSSVNSMISIMTRVTAQQFLEENLEDHSKYDFDKPFAEMIVKGIDGTERKMLFSRYGENTQTYTHVLFEESNQVALYYSGDIDFIKKNVDDFLVKQVNSVNKSLLSGMDMIYNGRSDTFELDSEGGTVLMNGKNLSEYGSEAYSSFTSMYNSISYITFDSFDLNLAVEYSDPVLSVVYRFSDGSEDLKFELVPAGEEVYAVFINGKYTGQLVDDSSISGKNKLSYFVENFLSDCGL